MAPRNRSLRSPRNLPYRLRHRHRRFIESTEEEEDDTLILARILNSTEEEEEHLNRGRAEEGLGAPGKTGGKKPAAKGPPKKTPNAGPKKPNAIKPAAATTDSPLDDGSRRPSSSAFIWISIVAAFLAIGAIFYIIYAHCKSGGHVYAGGMSRSPWHKDTHPDTSIPKGGTKGGAMPKSSKKTFKTKVNNAKTKSTKGKGKSSKGGKASPKSTTNKGKLSPSWKPKSHKPKSHKPNKPKGPGGGGGGGKCKSTPTQPKSKAKSTNSAGVDKTLKTKSKK